MKRVFSSPRLSLVMASIALFSLSLALPGLQFAQHEPVRGVTLLLWGWWGFLLRCPAWAANPAYVVSAILIITGHTKTARISAFAGIALALTSYSAREWWFNEAAGTPILRLGAAFYVWLASHCVLPISSFLQGAPNKSMKRNHRSQIPLEAAQKLVRAVYAPPVLSAVVAYLFCYMSSLILSAGEARRSLRY